MGLLRSPSVTQVAQFASKGFSWGPLPHLNLMGTTTIDSIAMSATGIQIAAIVAIDKTGTIDRVNVNIASKTGSDATVKYLVGIYTYDEATGLPTTTPYGGMAPANPTQVALTTGHQDISLATPATAVAGDKVAIVMKHDGTSTAPTTAYVTARYQQRIAGQNAYSIPSSMNHNGTAWAHGPNLPSMGYRYNAAGNNERNRHPIVVSSPVIGSIQVNATPDEVGALFTLPWDAKCHGAVLQVDVNSLAAAAYVVKLYDSANTLLASFTVGVNTMASSVMSLVWCAWTTVNLTAGAQYRLTIAPTTTDTVAITATAVPDTDAKNAILCGDSFQLTQRTDAGAWTDTPNTIPCVALLLQGAA